MTQILKMGALPEEINQQFEEVISELEKLPQRQIETEHRLHGGIYSRTLRVPAETLVVGLPIIVETQLVCQGHFVLTDGIQSKEFNGYHILEGRSGRRAAVRTLTDCVFTMIVATKATSVEEAENEFTNEPERLLSRKEKLICQEQQ